MVAPPEKASLLGSQFDSKQCREQFVAPLSCFPQSRCNYFLAFRTSVLQRLLLDLDRYGGVDSLSMFPLFLKKVADIIALKLSIIFRRLIRLGTFPECWRSANATAIPKSAPSPDRVNYRPISITPFCLRCMTNFFLASSPTFVRNVVYCLLLSLLIGKVWAARMHCLPYLIIFRSTLVQAWSLISFSSTSVQHSIE